ncbi:Sulfur carrier protein adenylyltransferase [Azospirillaceae bacterium]
MLNEAQKQRYARHLTLPEIGVEGQERLLKSRVLVVGAGGLGSPVLLYLIAAGVGAIDIVDSDRVEASNLQRQVLHDTPGIGKPKVASAIERLSALNPEISIHAHACRFTLENGTALAASCDVLVDCCDNAETRQALNIVSLTTRLPLVSGAIHGFHGQLTTFKPHASPEAPCRCCVFPQDATNTSTTKVEGPMGAIPGVIGALQAMETLKELLGIGSGLMGRLLLYNGLETSFQEIRLRRDPLCLCCADRETRFPAQRVS